MTLATWPLVDHPAENRILFDCLDPTTTTTAARLWFRPRFGTTAHTRVTFDFNLEFDRLRLTRHAFHEVEVDDILIVFPSTRRVRILTASAATEEHVENVTKSALEVAATELARPFKTKSVVLGPFLLIGQYFIRLADLFEFICCIRLLVNVWMIFSRELPIRSFNVLRRGRFI